MTVRLLKKSSLNFVVPHAILWRPIVYFSVVVRQEEDELDRYEVASFEIGNRVNFDLRHYRGHPKFTVSLYFSLDFRNEGEIIECVDLALSEMEVPPTAVAWKRGMDFEYGNLSRPSDDRLREAEARILALKIASRAPNRTASMRYIKKEIENYFEPSPADSRPSRTRREPMWKQIVGNVTSHVDANTGLFRRGLALRTGDGLTVTPSGLRYLKSIGFSSGE